MDCYVYYKSTVDHAIAIRHCVEVMCVQLSHQLDHLPRLQRRPAVNNGLITWMEIYCDVPENFEDILTAAVMHSGITSLITGERRLEYFIAADDAL